MSTRFFVPGPNASKKFGAQEMVGAINHYSEGGIFRQASEINWNPRWVSMYGRRDGCEFIVAEFQSKSDSQADFQIQGDPQTIIVLETKSSLTPRDQIRLNQALTRLKANDLIIEKYLH